MEKERVILVLDCGPDNIDHLHKMYPSADLLFLRVEDHQAFSGSQSAELVSIPDAIKKDVNITVLKELQSVSGINYNGKPLIDLFSQDNFNAWFYHRYRIYFTFCQLLYEVKFIESLTEKYAEVLVLTSGHRHARFCKKLTNVRFVKSTQPNRPPINWRYLRTFFLCSFIRFWKGLFLLGKFRSMPQVLITNPDHSGLQQGNGKQRWMHHYLARILSEAETENVAIIDLLMFPKLRGQSPRSTSADILRKRRNMVIGSEFVVTYFGLLRISTIRKHRKTSKKFRNNYNLIDSATDNPLHKAMLLEMAALHSSSMLYLLQYLSFQRLFKRCRHKVITSIDENSPNPKSILDAAKYAHIKTVGVQHGSIHYLHPVYMYAEQETAWSPFPDLTLLWGEHFKRLLIEQSAYTEEQLVVIGQPRTDFSFDETFNAMDNAGQFLPPTDAVRVMFASQPQQDPSLRKRAAIEVLTACGTLRNVELFIKLHPNEDKSYYEELTKTTGVPAIILKNEVNLYYLLNAADIVITCFSTVGAEAVFFRKPLIILDHLKQDVLEYAQKKVAIQTTNEAELKAAIASFIDSGMVYDEEAYASFIKDFAYAIDGKVYERYKEALSDRFQVG